MSPFNPLSAAGAPSRRRILSAALGAVLLAAPLCVLAAPANLDRSLDRPTDHRLFQVSARSNADPIPMSKIHQWTVHVAGADGRPVSGAELTVDGGMPEHGHGLPTAPRAAPGAAPGDYVISGMKFSMTGWWVLKLAIKAADGRADTITFNLVL